MAWYSDAGASLSGACPRSSSCVSESHSRKLPQEKQRFGFSGEYPPCAAVGSPQQMQIVLFISYSSLLGPATYQQVHLVHGRESQFLQTIFKNTVSRAFTPQHRKFIKLFAASPMGQIPTVPIQAFSSRNVRSAHLAFCASFEVTQVSLPAVSPISLSAEYPPRRRLSEHSGPAGWKPAIQQVGKPALLERAPGRFFIRIAGGTKAQIDPERSDRSRNSLSARLPKWSMAA